GLRSGSRGAGLRSGGRGAGSRYMRLWRNPGALGARWCRCPLAEDTTGRHSVLGSVKLSGVDIETPAEVKSYQETQNGPAALFRRRRRALPSTEQRPGLPGPNGAAGAAQEQWTAGAQQEAAPQPRRGIRFEGEKVLIVDDDIRNVFALTSVLEQHGLSVLYAENGREGIEVLEQHDDVTVVLMDIMMPEMDGYATTTAIRRMPQFAGLPIIALTAKAMKGDREKAIESGASDYVTKPVDPDHLLSVMEQWMREE
ncbi:response regulator, partial [Streptomyces sp. NPDC057927]